MIAQKDLKQWVHYDECSGVFTRIQDTAHTPIAYRKGTRAEGRNAQGYIELSINGTRYRAHQLAFVYMGEEVPKMIDHKDRVRHNNAWSNLRACTSTENNRNRKVQARSTTGHKGIGVRANGKFRASIGKKNLGTFTKLEDAIAARTAAEHKHYGDFATTK